MKYVNESRHSRVVIMTARRGAHIAKHAVGKMTFS